MFLENVKMNKKLFTSLWDLNLSGQSFYSKVNNSTGEFDFCAKWQSELLTVGIIF